LNDTRQLLVCAVDDNLMGEITHTTKKTDHLLVAQREKGLEVSAEQTVHIYFSWTECRTESQNKVWLWI
jgi:hypothetical protein